MAVTEFCSLSKNNFLSKWVSIEFKLKLEFHPVHPRGIFMLSHYFQTRQHNATEQTPRAPDPPLPGGYSLASQMQQPSFLLRNCSHHTAYLKLISLETFIFKSKP